MPLTVPQLSDLSYQDLVDEALARIPVHNPEWTNFNDSDPGVTLVQLFAFLTESLLYRSNQIPERNRRKFLTLLGIPLQPATPARGLVTFANERGSEAVLTLPPGAEVRSGEVAFRTDAGLDVFPVEWRVVYKRPVADPQPAQVVELYRELYVSFGRGGTTPPFRLYETVPLTPPGPLVTLPGVNLARDTIDRSLWIALLKRPADRDRSLESVRAAIGGKTLNLGLVPALADARRALSPGGPAPRREDAPAALRFEIPAGGSLQEADDRQPRYRTLEARTAGDPLAEPSVVQVTLPPGEQLVLWDNVEPLEGGVGDLPPALEDTALNDRLITWVRLRLRSAAESALSLVWAAPNTTAVTQRTRVMAELLPSGTGEPDQVAVLSRPPVIPGSVRLAVTPPGATEPEPWTEIDDLLSAGPELSAGDARRRPSRVPSRTAAPANVFQLDAESGTLTFGDGYRGRRPPFGAALRADYDYSVGREGNVGAGAIDSAPALPAGVAVRNEVPTWGGADAETVRDGERQISRHLQHRDRLVTAEDFETITRRTPGVDLGRVDVLPAFHPELSPNEPGDAPGAVTLLVVPRYDAAQPDAPRPDRLLMNAICRYLDPRRLVTTEVYLRGPEYRGIWISVGIRVEPGISVATVREAVQQRLRRFLSPLPAPPEAQGGVPQSEDAPRGWPLRAPVIRLQLLAEANRVPGVLLVNEVRLAEDAPTLTPAEMVTMEGLQLPRVIGLSVLPGDALPLDELRDQTLGAVPADPTAPPGALPLPLPVLPEECR